MQSRNIINKHKTMLIHVFKLQKVKHMQIFRSFSEMVIKNKHSFRSNWCMCSGRKINLCVHPVCHFINKKLEQVHNDRHGSPCELSVAENIESDLIQKSHKDLQRHDMVVLTAVKRNPRMTEILKVKTPEYPKP